MTDSRSLSRVAVFALATLLAIGTPTAALADDSSATAPEITAHPVSLSVAERQDAEFEISVSGSPEPEIAWERSDDDGTSWGAVAGGDSARLTVAVVTLEDDGALFRATVTNEADAVTSESAALTVHATAEDAGAEDAVEDAGESDPNMDPVGEADVEDAAEEADDAGADGAAELDETGTDGADAAQDDVVATAEPTDSETEDAAIETAGESELRLLSMAAPSSSASLAAGTYTITANLYVAGSDAPIGVNAYLTDSGFPPITAQTKNATLVVGADGALTLTVTAVQEIFTLQHIGDTDNAQVLSVTRGGVLNAPPADAPYSDRITDITFLLGDASGVYTFTDVIEYPVPLEVDKTWPIHLAVDFDSATRQVEGDYSRTFTDDATGISVTVEAEEGSSTIDDLQDAVFTVVKQESDEERAGADLAFSQAFTAVPGYELFSISLRSRGADLEFDDKTVIRLSIPTDIESPALYSIGSEATEVDSEFDAGVLSASPAQLGDFAVADTETATAWAGVKRLTGGVDGVSLTYATTGFLESMMLGLSFDVLDSFGFYNAFFSKVVEGDIVASAQSTLGSTGEYDDAAIEGIYALGMDMSMESFPGANQKHTPFLYFGSSMQTSVTGSVPAETSGSSVYLVTGTVGEGMTTAERLDASYSSGTAQFSLASNAQTLSSERRAALSGMWNAASGWDGYYDVDAPDSTQWTDATALAYIVVVHEAEVAVDKPAAQTGLVYSGTVQSGVATGEGYTFSGTTQATDAGDYVAIATLKDGYVWADGGSDAIAVTWSIAKAELTGTYGGESVAADGTPQLAVQVTGFVAGQTAADASGFTAPTVEAPASLVAGRTHTLTPSGGSATNYSFRYVSGILTVTAANTGALTAGTYRVTANLFVPASENDILGLTAYLTNPKNPLVAESDPDYGIPTSAVSDNATLVVAADGTRTLTVDLPNPAFTLIGFGTADGAEVLGVERDGLAYGSNTGGRITTAVIELDEGATTVTFRDSHVYAAPLRLDKTWDIHLAVDLSSAVRTSGSTTTTVPSGDGSSPSAGGSSGTTTNSGTTGASTGPRTSSSKTLRAGTYTVSANIWLSREDTGLPLDPHLTSSAFPPMDPVTDNATLVVSSSGRATVTVPITIQSRIMTVRSISGLGVGTSGGGAVTSVTIDLGVITDPDAVINRSLTASVSIGDLAMSIGGSIFGGTTEHTWPAAFQLNLSGVPTSGGGSVPAWASAALLDTDEDADDAAAEAALEAAKQANEESQQAATGSPAAAEGSTNPAGIPAGVLWGSTAVILVLAAASALIVIRRLRATP